MPPWHANKFTKHIIVCDPQLVYSALPIIGPEGTSVQVVAVSFEEGTFHLEAQNDILLTQWPMPLQAFAKPVRASACNSINTLMNAETLPGFVTKGPYRD